MTTPRDPDRLVQAFLAEGPTELPDRTYDAVRGQIDRTHQRVVIGPWREPRMNNIAKAAIGAAAVLAIAIGGLRLLPNGGQVGSVTSSPTPSPTASSTSAPSAAASPIPSTSDFDLAPMGPLNPGRYQAVSEVDKVPFSFTLPAGWKSEGWYLTNRTTEEAHTGLIVSFLPVANVYEEPCASKMADPPVGPSVTDLAAALVALPGTTASSIRDVVLDGHAAKLVEYTINPDVVCTTGQFYLWHDKAGGDMWEVAPFGDTVQEWILDVDGNRFVITAVHHADTSEADLVVLQELIDSVAFGG